MLDARVRSWIDPVLNRLARILARMGLGANTVTWGGFGFGVLAWLALAYREYDWAMGLILLNRVADGLDGALARKKGITDLGGYLDIVLDFIFYAGVPFFFAVGRPESALPAAFLIFSFIGTGCSFLAYATIAAKRGISTEKRGRKSFYYLGGITEGTETILLFLAITIWPGYFDWMAWIFGSLCWLTTATRIGMAHDSFRKN